MRRRARQPDVREVAPAEAAKRSLGGDRLVNGELVDVRRPLRLDARRREPFGNARRERVKVRTRLPEVHDSPTALDGAGRMEQESLRRRAIRIDLIVALVELLLGDPQELDADAYSHLQPRFRLGERLYAPESAPRIEISRLGEGSGMSLELLGFCS